MPPDKDLYQVLGLQKDASAAQIKKAWQDASREHHPDKNPHPDSTKRMQEINHAHDMLSDPEKRRRYDQTGQDIDLNQGYSASRPKKTGGNSAHDFNTRPAHPTLVKSVCYWCRDANSLFQTGLCPQHLWCCRCFILRHTIAAKDARCCGRMVPDQEVIWRLPSPVAALYEMKRACNFEYWGQPKLYTDLCAAVKDWQEKNPSLAYGSAASQALCEKDKKIKRLQEQLAEFYENRKSARTNVPSVQAELDRQQSTIQRLEEELKNAKTTAKAAPSHSESKMKDDLIRKDMRIKELERSTKIAKDANARNIENFSVAQKARNAAVASEAAMRKEKDELATELATTRSKLEQLQQTPPQKGPRAQDELATAIHDRDAATAKEAATEKRNRDLEAELAKLQRDLQAQRHTLADQDTKHRTELSTVQSARDTVTQNESAMQKRCEDLEIKLVKVQVDLQTQQQDLVDRELRHQVELSTSQSVSKKAIANEITAKEELEAMKAQLVKVHEERAAAQTSSGFLQHRTNVLERRSDHDGKDQQSGTKDAMTHEAKGPHAVAPTQIKLPIFKTLFESRKASRDNVLEEPHMGRLNTPRRVSQLQSTTHATPNSSSPRAPIAPQMTSQQTPTPASRQTARPMTAPHSKAAVTSPASVPLPATPAKSPFVHTSATVDAPSSDTAKEALQGAAAAKQQSSQDKGTGSQTKAFDLATFQKTMAASKPSLTFSKTNEVIVGNDSRPDHMVKPVLHPTNTTMVNTIPQPSGQVKQPISTTSKTDDKPTTPTNFLKGQLHYAKATQKAAQEDARRATEEIADLKAELKRYKKFEIDADQEFSRANKEYESIQRELEKTRKQLRQCKRRSGGAFKVPADQFANPIEDNDKNVSELLARLNENFKPIKVDIRKSRAARKINKKYESPLKVSARKNRKLRDTIRQKNQEIADIRIDYGNRWANILDNVCAKESEIRRLKKTLHIPKSRSSSQASIGALDPPPLSAKGQKIRDLKIRAGLLRFDATRKDQQIEVLSKQAKDVKDLKTRAAQLRFDLDTFRQRINGSKDPERRTST